MFATLKEKLDKVWKDISGEARAEAEQALHDAEAELLNVGPLVTKFKADLAGMVADAEPGLKSAVTALADKLASDLAGIIKL